MKSLDLSLLEDAAAYIDRWVEYRQRTLQIPGIAIGVGFQDRILLSAAYGMADVERAIRLTPSHRFRIASHSKTFTATAVMQLVERGQLRLDDRVGDRLDWLPNRRGEIGQATLRQLLSHSGGVIRDGLDAGFWQLERDFPDLDEFRDLITRTPTVLAANQQFKYSNFGYSLLGMVVESAAGQSYNDYVRDQIVGRLGLENTGPEFDARARDSLATGYSVDVYGLDRWPLAHLATNAMSAATGFYSTAEDLLRYGRAHFTGNEELLSEESKREMRHEHWKVEGVPASYGLGFDITMVGERRMIGHGGGFPGFITNTKFDPDDQLVVVALTNASDGPAAELTVGMVRIIERALKAKPVDAAGPGAADLGRYTGRFWSIGGATDLVRFGAELLAVSPELPNPMELVAELAADGDAGLRIASAPGFHSSGERVSFDFDSRGEVERVRLAGSSLLPWAAFESRVLPSLRATGRAPQRQPSPAADA